MMLLSAGSSSWAHQPTPPPLRQGGGQAQSSATAVSQPAAAPATAHACHVPVAHPGAGHGAEHREVRAAKVAAASHPMFATVAATPVAGGRGAGHLAT